MVCRVPDASTRPHHNRRLPRVLHLYLHGRTPCWDACCSKSDRYWPHHWHNSELGGLGCASLVSFHRSSRVLSDHLMQMASKPSQHTVPIFHLVCYSSAPSNALTVTEVSAEGVALLVFNVSLLSQTVYTFSSHLGLIRCLTLIVKISTQHDIHTSTESFVPQTLLTRSVHTGVTLLSLLTCARRCWWCPSWRAHPARRM